jgi:hypothetical protein
VTLIRKEIREFESRDRAGRLLYPGRWIVTWIKTPHLPWMCAGMAPVASTHKRLASALRCKPENICSV